MNSLLPAKVPVYSGEDRSKAMDYSLVLSSEGFKHWIEFDESSYRLLVEEQALDRAHEALAVYERENEEFFLPDETPLSLELFLAPLAILLVPTLAYFAVGFSGASLWLKRRGMADSQAILEGEWWRTITALTLHADHAHFLGNLVSGYFILNLLNHRLRLGTMLFGLTVLSGLTNGLVAWYAHSPQLSLGFSTFVFAALGLLAAVETRHWRGAPKRNLRQVTPLLSAFFLAVMMGLGENADVRAHFFGFFMGMFAGLACYRKGVRTTAWMQAFLLLGGYALYALAWRLAVS